MSVSREEIVAVMNAIEIDCQNLEEQVGGSQKLCRDILDWFATGKELQRRMERAEQLLLETLDHGKQLRLGLIDRLSQMEQDDSADWWKS